ncbi:MAG: hypothetical protein AB1489_11455 [Acidobacteriota bacterium]
MRFVNGWGPEDVQLLITRTGQPEEAILNFCRAIDKQLYLLLPSHIKRASLHFHLRVTANSTVADASQVPGKTSNIPTVERIRARTRSDNIVQIQEFLQRRAK